MLGLTIRKIVFPLPMTPILYLFMFVPIKYHSVQVQMSPYWLSNFLKSHHQSCPIKNTVWCFLALCALGRKSKENILTWKSVINKPNHYAYKWEGDNVTSHCLCFSFLASLTHQFFGSSRGSASKGKGDLEICGIPSYWPHWKGVGGNTTKWLKEHLIIKASSPPPSKKVMWLTRVKIKPPSSFPQQM